MVTTQQTTRAKNFVLPANVTGKLDKLEYLTQPAPNKGLQSLAKRAKCKFVQVEWLKALIDLDTPLQKKYIDTLKCSSSIKQKGEKFTSRYCGNRWCLICNRIRTAKLLNSYSEVLDNLKDKQFVTLTRPNVKAEHLKEELTYFYTWWRAMMRISVKEGKNLNGVRKLEITYNHTRKDYHPHFHLIVEGKEQASYILDKWLKANPTASPEAQDIRNCFDYKDLFKYVTKMTTKINVGGESFDYFFPEATDNIFQAIKGVRIYQPFGSVLQDRKVDDLTENIEVDEALTIEGKEGDKVYKWVQNNWYDIATDEPLTDFLPDKELFKYRKRIVNHHYRRRR